MVDNIVIYPTDKYICHTRYIIWRNKKNQPWFLSYDPTYYLFTNSVILVMIGSK